MKIVAFEDYKQSLISSLQGTETLDELEDKIFEAQWDLTGEEISEPSEETMLEIIGMSEADAKSGRVYSMEEVERLIDQKEYELIHRMDSYCVAEP